jgi:hypothetical protein
MKRIFVVLTSLVMLSACAGGGIEKKVLIMGRGDIVVAENTVNMTKGTGYAEKEVTINEKGPVTWTVETASGKQTINLPEEKGYYILNLKTDTVVGSVQLIGKDLTNTRTITQEELKLKIDSLVKLTVGTNVNFTSNFFVIPNQVLKVSANTDARVFGPFKKIPSQLDAGPDDKEPEIYKFYTNTELRELIQTLKGMTF